MNLKTEHARGDVVAELLDLLADVAKEGVAWPAPNHRHDKDKAFAQVHGHGGSRANGVAANLVGLDSD